jgi:hypothetical protein
LLRAPVLVRRQRLAHFAIVATKAEWPTVSVAVLQRRLEKSGELHWEKDLLLLREKGAR